MLHKLNFNTSINIHFKPGGKYTGIISNGIINVKEVTIKDFSQYVTQPYGYAWTSSYIEGSRKSENWRSQSVFYLDYDDGTTFDEILKRFDAASMRPNIIYNTLSDTPEKRKFRVVMFFDGIIDCKKTALYLQSNLVDLFKSDPNCKTVERMIYPGYSVLYLDEVENEIEDLFKTINTFVISKDKNGNNNFRIRGIKEYELKIDENDTPVYRITNLKSENKEAFECKRKIVEDFNWDKSFETIKILDDFNKGIRIKHAQIFGLASSLKYIKGGLLYMKNKMNEVNRNLDRVDMYGNKADPYVPSDFATLPFVNAKNYSPESLSKFSPYIEDHDYNNIIDATKWQNGRIDVLYNEPKMTLEDAENKLKVEFVKTIREITNLSPLRFNSFIGDLYDECEDKISFFKTITIFKVPTGLGKTQQLEKIKNVLIATKTNRLKNELSDRMDTVSNEHYVTPDYPSFSNEYINDLISSYTNSNLYEQTSKLIKKISEGSTIRIDSIVYTPTKDDILLAQLYKDENKKCRETFDTVITTHKRVILDTSFNHDILVFDECPLDTIVEHSKYVFNFSIFDNTPFKNDIEPIEKWVRNDLGFNQIVNTPTFEIKNYSKFAEFCALNGESNLIKLLDSDFIFRDNTCKSSKGEVVFISKKDLPNKHIIIMSATAPIHLYKHIFGDKIKVIDISNVEKKGKIKQYTSKSWSRSSLLRSSEKSLVNLKDLVGDKPVITFMNFKKIFKNPSIFHFGNTAGYDELKGLDIAVVGTDNKPIHVYFFYAKLTGMDIKGSDNTLDNRVIDWNGFRFRIMTFENETLKDIQLSIIESELIQAVGRNRNLRENCTTLLFSSLPLRISDEFIWDKN